VTTAGGTSAGATFTINPPSNPTFTANPNPIVVPAGTTVGQATLTWSAPGYSQLAIFLRSPGGQRMTGTLGPSGTLTTDPWVFDGLQFFLVDLITQTAIANVTVHVTPSGPPPAPTFTANPNPIVVPAGTTVGQATLTWNAPGYSQLAIFLRSPTGQQMTGPLPPAAHSRQTPGCSTACNSSSSI
jgi:hypothetical protein